MVNGRWFWVPGMGETPPNPMYELQVLIIITFPSAQPGIEHGKG